ncbi:hypothetical protein A33K_13490 [Burkholderia humptydooensis MSMB43]|uniref:Uncharacterized protein n=1 Tax=Burkholderia humptydooensis MSMB43 TaxID=441157 RepID=A0ABN0GCP5_9BURK|nr:hypothetical protein A33K_13490 [Burkholderia humptydooensis MSMB43]
MPIARIRESGSIPARIHLESGSMRNRAGRPKPRTSFVRVRALASMRIFRLIYPARLRKPAQDRIASPDRTRHRA